MTIVTFWAWLLASCGYHFTAGAGRLPDGSRDLSIPQAANLTSEAALGAHITKSLRDEAVRAGLRLTGSSTAPRLLARLLSVKSVPRSVVAYGGAFHTREQEVQVRLELELNDGSTSAFKQVFSGRESYLSAPDLRGTIANRDLALRRLLSRLVHDGIDSLTRTF